jgi:hypothetical protein
MSTSAIAKIEEVEEFFELVRGGAAEMVAAHSVNWTPLKLKKLKKDKDFLELLADAQEHFLDAVETTVGTRALAGNRWAVEMVLYNRRPDRWRPAAQKIAIESHTTVKHEVVLAVRDAAKELLTQGGGATVAALQQRAIEAHVSDD